MRQSEKALRDAGWEETTCGDLDKGEEFYLLGTGALLRGNLGILDAGEKVLRAPRPEPEYEPGTVVWANTSDSEQALISVGLPGAMRWIGKASNGLAALYSQDVEVLRVIAYPDGSISDDEVFRSEAHHIGYAAGYDHGMKAGLIKLDGETLPPVGRVEVIDGTGRAYVNTSAEKVELSVQDDGRTLKVFTGGTGATPRPVQWRPGDSFGQCVTDVDAASERMDARGRELLERLWEKLDGEDNTK